MIAILPEDSPPMLHPGEDVEELSLFVPRGQIMALAEAAESEGLTAAQFIRRLLARALSSLPTPFQSV